MEVRRYNSPRRVANVRARMHRQHMQGGKAFPLEHPLSLITSDYRLSERDDQSSPATALMTNVFLSLSLIIIKPPPVFFFFCLTPLRPLHELHKPQHSLLLPCTCCLATVALFITIFLSKCRSLLQGLTQHKKHTLTHLRAFSPKGTRNW